MKEIPVTQFKAHCTQILREVADTPYTVTRRGKPIALLSPVRPEDTKRPKTVSEFMGCLKGTSIESGDIISSLDEKWDACT
jgi:prevent-host-death family protein